MNMKDEIKACLIASMEMMLDPYMIEHGFSRHAKSLVYKRHLQGSKQIIDVTVQVHPKDNPSAAAAVYPIMEVEVPAVDSVLQDMIGDNLGLLEGVTKGLSNQPIEFTSQKAEKARWYVYQSDSVPDIIEGIKMFIDRWTIPFLDVYVTPEDIVAADERGDGRMVADRAHRMRVVAAALVCNRKDYAQALMEKRLGALGARRRYQQVYDYIQQAA
ncbi:hypothetical protein FHR22_001659 [Sphingopyxis panaciterrae]|uniref:hypothetical protein n=1 Tax=Sphingopyxis panaciterrae TaxID=363841 RepID=UPI00141E627B|nr:hypothetical protein [Sphingopyxis panaciterrae]NIJ36975.1 hypothetical protein [Sphingopyxis panaciterrae]